MRDRWRELVSPRWVEWALAALSLVYFAYFVAVQIPDIPNTWILEWDTRATSLPAWRYHGTGLFPNDLIVDYMGAFYGTPGWSVLFWVGTLFADPLVVTKVVPLFALAVVVWQGGAFGYRRFGPAGFAVSVVMLVSTYWIWFRLLGFNSRGFGFPLLCAFVRYTDAKAEKRALATLFIAALSYPSVLLLMGPAYGLVLLFQRAPLKAWMRLAGVGALCFAVMARQMLFPDPRVGRPPTYEQAATLRQMGPGSNQPFYPLASAHDFLMPVVEGFFEPAGKAPWRKARTRLQRHRIAYAALFAVALGALTRRRLKNLPLVFGATLVSAIVMYFVIRAVAYRLYLPDRPLTFAYPVALALGLPVLAYEAFTRLTQKWAPVLAALTVSTFFLLMRGDGVVPPAQAMPNYAAWNTPVLGFVRTLPKDVLIVAHPEQSSVIQAYAQRSTLFSMHSNTPFFYQYALEMEARFEEFYVAFYATSWEPFERLRDQRGVTHVVYNEADLGADALSRALYAEPWDSLNELLINASFPEDRVLAHPPPEAVVFHEGGEIVVDLRLLPPDAE